MLDKNIAALISVIEGLVHFAGQVQLLPQPDRHTLEKLPESPGGVANIGFQQTFEFQQRLFIKDHVIDIANRNTAPFQTGCDGAGRKPLVVFFAGKPFFLRGGNNFTVADQRSRTVVIIR